MRTAVCLVGLTLATACAEPYANDPIRRAWYDDCDRQAQLATASNPSMHDRVATRVHLNRDCMALKERQAGLR